jgi:hypothetical protein
LLRQPITNLFSNQAMSILFIGRTSRNDHNRQNEVGKHDLPRGFIRF